MERETGRLLVTGTACSTETYIERYLETGDPHGELSRRVALEATAADLDKLSAIQAVRDLAGLGMLEAKVLVDRSMKGETVIIVTADAETAGQLIARLAVLGWSARRHYE